MTLKFDGWPRKIIAHLFYTTSSFLHNFKSIRDLNWSNSLEFFVLCDLETWWKTLENNRAPLLYYIKLCASFQSHGWIQTGVTVGKRSNRVKISNFLSAVTLKFDGWPWNTIGHLFDVASSFVDNFIAIREFKLDYSPETPNLGQNQWFFYNYENSMFFISLTRQIRVELYITSIYVLCIANSLSHTHQNINKVSIN